MTGIANSGLWTLQPEASSQSVRDGAFTMRRSSQMMLAFGANFQSLIVLKEDIIRIGAISELKASKVEITSIVGQGRFASRNGAQLAGRRARGNVRSTVEILIMHTTGAANSLCIMRFMQNEA
jgi:hypothetical protein